MQNEAELARVALEFLKRCDLKGGDVPAYVAVNNWLQDKMAPQEENVVPKEKKK